MCKEKQHVNPNYKLTKLFWVASMEKWLLQAGYSVVSSALQLQIAKCWLNYCDCEVLLSLSLSAFADSRNAYSHLRSGNYNT
jgi:hypothetical protein